MGLPDNRDIEPVREDFSSDIYNDQPEFVIMDQGENGQMMDVDDDDESGHGYLRLQTFEGDDIPANDSDTSGSDDDEDEDENQLTFTNENIEDNSAPDPSIPNILTADSEIQVQVWNEPRQPQDTIELNSEKTQQILKAMSKFSLPNVPAWANEVNPSDLVKQVLSKNKNSPATPSDKN